jgi:hypothetical protein
VTGTGLLQHWVETRRIQPIGYWVEAIYQVCLLDPAPEHRASLAQAMLAAEALGLGLPPTLLGADPEVVARVQQVPCPSPCDARLRVANLGRSGVRELVVVNPTPEALELDWSGHGAEGLQWSSSVAAGVAEQPLAVPARGWLIGTSG